jgi:recombinational DNA repair protein RecT
MPKRIPGMYAFYSREIQKALDEDNYEEAERLTKDAPQAVYEALVRNEVIEVSVEESRKGYEGDKEDSSESDLSTPTQLELF